MSEIKLEIDGKEITGEEGQSVLEAASENGIKIPTHCYHEKYEPTGSCRLCLVEVRVQGGRPELKAACTYPVQENLVVKTKTKEILKTRRLTAELMLARCPESQAVREIAEEFGVKKPRFSLKNLNCTLCGLCVKACETAKGESAITFAGRGTNRKIIAPFELSPKECEGCGACAAVCPTSAIKMVNIEEE
ncbi:hypothetical protein AKJ43_02405 [candidate division MSBL1 archaeon SCGC-AAA261D19]|uniref:(2Fe-2S)-binding protein n=1 Tax=candidate division MSBL1 archaeon SCGC-AAA261D19 TaxID=1698273 RepID=A0A133V6V0_9EURY|nr:hypothetical protein AKJ43_02405 [candidate division MSBL1 archaeon SCGC-AAA261D19]